MELVLLFLYMRSTKSKLRLAYHKYLLSIEKRRTELSNRKPDEENYIEIPRILIGYKIKLIPVDSLKNHDEGLAEAVDASTSWFYFSDKPFRLCNLKDYRCEYRRNLHYWDCWEKENFEKAYFQNRIFKKGQLKLLDITEEAYEKLNDFAKKYFIQGFDRYDKRGNPVYIYHPDIPKTYVREYEEKLFWNRLYIPDGEALSEEKKLDNWLNYKRECELWHYEGWKTSRYSKWERKVFHKQNRVRLKIEMDEVIQEYFEGE